MTAPAHSDDEDELISALEAESEQDPALTALRERRIAALSSEFAHAKAVREYGYGSYTTTTTEKDLLDITTSPDYKQCVVHFFKDDFTRCRIMDSHLKSLAEKHLECRFLRMDVQNAPFLVVKLGIKILPCVIGFVDGVGLERIVGFDGLIGGDSFETVELENKLIRKGVLKEVKTSKPDISDIRDNTYVQNQQGRSIKQGKLMNDDDDDDDWP